MPGLLRSLLLILLAAAPPLAAQGAPARWTLVREARIGAEDGPGALTEVRNLVVDPRGTVYVGQPAERTVKVFDASGRLLRRIGRGGGGPGEFSAPGRMGWRDDTLWVADFATRRLSAFAAGDGRFLLSHRLPAWAGWGTQSPIRSAVSLADGSLLARPDGGVARVGSGEIASEPLLRLEPPAMRLDTLAWLSTRNRLLHAELGEGRLMSGPQWVSDAPLWEAAPDGRSIVLVERTAAASRDSAVFTVRRLRPDGGTVYRRSFRYAPAAFPRGYDRVLVERYLGGRPAALLGNRAAAERGVRRAMFLPRYRPPVTQLVVGRDGTVWLRREEPAAGASAVWNVLDDAGRLMAVAVAPAGVEVLAADRTHAWGVEKDELDVPYVVRLRVTPR